MKHRLPEGRHLQEKVARLWGGRVRVKDVLVYPKLGRALVGYINGSTGIAVVTWRSRLDWKSIKTVDVTLEWPHLIQYRKN